jgi:hypothetical protein
MGFKQKNPSPAAQLRKVRAERQGFERPIDAKYTRAREFFKFGKHAQGMTL